MKNRATIICTAILISTFAGAADPALPLVPWPKDVKLGDGEMEITAKSAIVAADALLAQAKVLQREIRIATGLELKIVSTKPNDGDIDLELSAANASPEYRLAVGGSAKIDGGNETAIGYGTATFLQSVRVRDGKVFVPNMKVTDSPTFQYRALMIDPGRKFHSIDGIKQVVELCRLYKLRFLHLHLSDDQLFMFPSTAFPTLGKGNREFARFDPPSAAAPIRPYALAELKDLEEFARARGVAIIPEIDMPGHSSRLVGDAPESFRGDSKNGVTINIASPKVREAAATLLNEVLDVFQSTPYVHLGGDEVSLDGIDKTDDYKKSLAEFKLKSSHDLYRKFISDMIEIVKKRGKHAIVWEEAYTANAKDAFPLPKDTLVMAWCLNHDPQKIMNDGYGVINGSWVPYYIVRDNKQPAETLFNWSVNQFAAERQSKPQFTTKIDANLAGVQLLSWENSESIEIQSMRERGAAMAEQAWNPQAKRDYADFCERLKHTDAILEKLVHPVSIVAKGSFTKDESSFDEPLTISLLNSQPDTEVRYTLDNRAPDAKSAVYSAPFELKENAWIRAAAFTKDGERRGYVSGAWYKRTAKFVKNLATGKPVTCTNPESSIDPKIAVDGDLDVNHHWAGKTPSSLTVDLEKIYKIDRATLVTYYDGGRYYQYTVEVSTDGAKWALVDDASKNTGVAAASGYESRFPATDARYVRVNMLKNSANIGTHIVELMVFEAK